MASSMAFFTAWATVIVTSSTCYYSTTCPPISREYLLRLGVAHRFYPGPMRDHVLKGATFRNVSCRSYAICATFCLLDDACKSFNFCMDDNFCQLNSAVYSKNEPTLQKSSGCLYFDESFHEQQQDDKNFMPSTASTASTPSTVKPLCEATVTTRDDEFDVLPKANEPLRLEFTVVSYDASDVYMSFHRLDGPHGYDLDFIPTVDFEVYNDTTKSYSLAGPQRRDFNALGKPVVLTLGAGQFTLTSDDGLFQSAAPLAKSTWLVRFGSKGKADWIVDDPCILSDN